MPWIEQMALGVADMDATHREFIGLVEALLAADDGALPQHFAELLAHTRQHFEHEAALMKACRFPATGEHTSEHLRVLGELAFIGRGVTQGRLSGVRQYAQGLPAWFATHLATMDAALAACLKRQAGVV